MSSRALLASALLLAVAGCFTLDRTVGIEPGSVAGAAVDEDGARVRDVVVGIEGTGRVHGSDDGAFVVAGLPAGQLTLRLTIDADNDGVVDRGARVPFVLDVGADERVGFVLVGDVTLPKTATIRGRVVDGDGVGVAGARVVAAAFADDVVSEAVAAVDSGAGGVFVLDGVLAGDVTVVASGPGAASVGVAQRVAGGDDVDVGDVAVLAGGADANITVRTLPDVAADIAFVRRPDAARIEAPADVVVVPPGVFDVEVAVDGASAGSGLLKDLAVPRDRRSLQVVVVVEGVTSPGTDSGGGTGEPPDTSVDAGVDPGRPPDEPASCASAVVIDNGVASPPAATFAGCESLASLKISGGSPSSTILDALREVRVVEGDVVIDGTTLPSLDFLTSLKNARRLEIRNNAALTAIDLGVELVDEGILITNNGTQSLTLVSLVRSSSVELGELPLTAMTASSPDVATLILRGVLGAQTQIINAFGSTRRVEIRSVVDPILPSSSALEQLVLDGLVGMSFATLTAVQQLIELDVQNSTIDIDDLNAWQPIAIEAVTFLTNRGADDNDLNGWIELLDVTPTASNVFDNTRTP